MTTRTALILSLTAMTSITPLVLNLSTDSNPPVSKVSASPLVTSQTTSASPSGNNLTRANHWLDSINYPALLQALSDVESGSDDDAVGAKGERGRYQISPALWHSYSKLPLTCAHNHCYASTVAEWILSNYASDSANLNLFDLRYAIERWRLGRFPVSDNFSSHTQRVYNLYLHYCASND